ncbi:TES protein, partial [Polypterus senegalus]
MINNIYLSIFLSIYLSRGRLDITDNPGTEKPWAHVFPVSHRPNTVPSTKHTKTTLSCSTTPPRQPRPLPPDSGLDCWEAGPFIPHPEVFQVPDQLVLIAPPGGADKPSSVVAGCPQHPLAATPSPNRAAVVDSMSHGATGKIEEGSTAREAAPKRPGEGTAMSMMAPPGCKQQRRSGRAWNRLSVTTVTPILTNSNIQNINRCAKCRRKICRNCKCGLEDHDVQTTSEEDKKVGRLLEDTKYSSLIAKLKTDDHPLYKRNVVTLTSPVSAKKDVDIKTITYEWAPPVPSQIVAVRYIEMLPKAKQPVFGTEGAVYRKKQMARQLPEHDQDPSKCHELSPNEVKKMEQFVKKYKDEALGVGDIKIPEELEMQVKDKGANDTGNKSTKTVVGAMGDGASTGQKKTIYSCYHCKLNMKEGDPAVYAERAGYDKLWHPACFVCCVCSELLVDLIYFWKKDKLYCGRHYCDSEKPRCGGCDEV